MFCLPPAHQQHQLKPCHPENSALSDGPHEGVGREVQEVTVDTAEEVQDTSHTSHN